jgi:hypothetical protein
MRQKMIDGCFEVPQNRGSKRKTLMVDLALNVAAFLFLAFVALVAVGVIITIVGMIIFYPFAKLYDAIESLKRRRQSTPK